MMEREDFEKLITAIKVMPLRPDDRIVLRMPGQLGDAGRETVVSIGEALFPGHRVVVLDEGADVDIIREEAPAELVDAMVQRFLSWKLPKDFAPDCGIVFDGRKPDQWNPDGKGWPIGTNLLTAAQAKEMIEHLWEVCREH